MIRLVDIHGRKSLDGITYIGRAGKNGKPAASPLANPFRVEDHGPLALRLCMLHFIGALARSDARVVPELGRLAEQHRSSDVVLGCWCCSRPAVLHGLGLERPERECHGDIVATIIEAWGVSLRTYATGPDAVRRWSGYMARTMGKHPASVIASAFGRAELHALADLADEKREQARAAGREPLAPDIRAGLPAWMR